MKSALTIAGTDPTGGAGLQADIRVFNRLGITKVETNPELETNANVQGQWKYYEKRQHKRRRIFIKHL